MVAIADLADELHDYWISFAEIDSTTNSVVIGGWFDHGRERFRFKLNVTSATLGGTDDPDDLGGFQVSDCRLQNKKLLIWGDGPPGSVEILVTPESTVELARDQSRWMVRRFFRWEEVVDE
jgi:hypothetical protein